MSVSSTELHDALAEVVDQLEAALRAEVDVALQRATSRLASTLGAMDIADVELSVRVTQVTLRTRPRPSASRPLRRGTPRPKGPVWLAVLGVLTEAADAMTVNQIREQLGRSVGTDVSRSTVAQTVTRMVKAGAVDRVSTGRYRARSAAGEAASGPCAP